MKKIFFLVSLLLIVTGCSNNQFKPNYDKMQVSDNGINGYSLYLSVSGKVAEDEINKIIIIDNYKNREYKIVKINAELIESEIKEQKGEDEKTNEDIFYVLNNKLYVVDKDGKYAKDTKNSKYNDPAIYLEGLKSATNVSEPKEKVSGETGYDAYDVTFSKQSAKKILNDLEIKGLKLTDDIKGQINLYKDGYVKNIIYNIENITINAIYYKTNKATEIFFPAEIEADKK